MSEGNEIKLQPNFLKKKRKVHKSNFEMTKQLENSNLIRLSEDRFLKNISTKSLIEELQTRKDLSWDLTWTHIKNLVNCFNHNHT
ncbi:hypothetical protein TetV_287 [Tetraselmis virus 1]|uniref:Uncharacterized protein n=1 Tax=Tetraselmis virus 1 TaxID=2060617 RepID=A0A2P0VNQ6_9VIRU|nr:hypothetical protein QJ968_gp287 [Tetraselmis virus 1]AUF82379.1 hypothetical protein TetV_287 [Tetraselmis virus 1]